MHRGAKPPITLPTSVDYDPREGRKEEYRSVILRGDRATIEATLQAAGVAYAIDPIQSSPCDEIRYRIYTAEDGTSADTDDNISTTWSRTGLEISQSIWRNKFVQAEFDKMQTLDESQTAAGLTPPSAQLRMVLEAYTRNQRSINDPNNEDGDEIICTWPSIQRDLAAFGLDASVFTLLVRSISRGQESELYHTFELQKVRLVGKDASFVHNITGENGLYTMARFVSEESPPSNLRWQLPSTGYVRKHAAEIMQQSDGSWSVTQRWTYVEQFSPLSYTLFA